MNSAYLLLFSLSCVAHLYFLNSFHHLKLRSTFGFMNSNFANNCSLTVLLHLIFRWLENSNARKNNPNHNRLFELFNRNSIAFSASHFCVVKTNFHFKKIIMNKFPQIEITLYENRYGYKNERQKNVKWLQTMIPVIMRTQKMITDDLYIAPLGHAIRICLS